MPKIKSSEDSSSKIQDAIDEATRLAGMALANLDVAWHNTVPAFPPAIRDGLVVRAALSYLLGAEMLSPTDVLLGDDEAESCRPTLDIAEPYMTNLTTKLHEEVATQFTVEPDELHLYLDRIRLPRPQD